MTPTWCVSSLVTQKPRRLSAAPLMVRDPVRYGWMKWHAQEVSRISTTAVTVDGETMIVLTAETPVCSVPLFAWQMAVLTMAVWKLA